MTQDDLGSPTSLELLSQLYQLDPLPARCEHNKHCTAQWEKISRALADEGHQELAERWRIFGWSFYEQFKSYADLLGASHSVLNTRGTWQ